MRILRTAETAPISSRHQFQCSREPRADANGGKIATICRQNSVHLPPLSDSGHCSIDQPQLEVLELGIELERSNKIRRERGFVFVAGSRVKYLRDKFSHSRPVVAKKVVHLCKNEPRK